MKNKFKLMLYALSKITDLEGNSELSDFVKIDFKTIEDIKKTYFFLNFCLVFFFITFLFFFFSSIYFLYNKMTFAWYISLGIAMFIYLTSFIINLKIKIKKK